MKLRELVILGLSGTHVGADSTGTTTGAPTTTGAASPNDSAAANGTTTSQNPFTTTALPGTWAVNYADACSGTEVSIELCVDLPPCGECKPQECMFSAWKDWSAGDCTGLCERQRTVETPNNECGIPCTGGLIETSNQSACQTSPCLLKQDCEWDDWSTWGGCSCTCGGGQHQRDRHIMKAPIGGGDLCEPLTRTEVGPCNTQECGEVCTDGEWGEWEEWGQCTHTCGGGAQVRSRNVKVEASSCGTPVVGLRQEFQPCNTDISCVADVDCVLGEWGVWSDCTCTCNGVKRRSRRIETYGRGNGLWCTNATKEISACNLIGVAEGCEGEKEVDCDMSPWKEWSACSKDCGGGQMNRLRRILTEPKGMGIPCNGPLDMTEGCNTHACMINGTMPIDCAWGEWSEWGACDKCNGQRHRFRNIAAMPEFGGQDCKLSDTEETDRCARNCHGPLWCSWGDWSEFSRCTKTCGKGTMRRERHLAITEKEPAEDGIVKKYSVMNDKMSEFETVIENRPKEIATSFTAGFFSLVAGFGVLRLFRKSDDVSVYQRNMQSESGELGAMLGPEAIE